MNYRSIADLNALVVQWLRRLPRDLDVIVGIPRSGMLVANMLALHLNLPLTDVDGLLQSRLMPHGRRCRALSLREPQRVLVVDDSLNTGDQLTRLRQQIASAALPHEIRYGAAYIRPGSESQVDVFGEVLPNPRIFEWNLLHHPILLTSCLDIDGVLCEDPSDDANDDGPRYHDFLCSAKPLVIPSVPVGWLVTCRLERYRYKTEQWLGEHDVQYRELIMLGLPDRASRMAAQSHGQYKAAVYQATGAELFIESSLIQALEIAELSRKSVFCMDTREMLAPPAKVLPNTSTTALPSVESARRARNPQLASSATWTARLQAVVQELLELVPSGESALVMDECQWGLGRMLAGRRLIPFLEREGEYWGPPPDEQSAILELERLRESGAHFAIVGWPAFWLLEHYPQFDRHLRSRYRCRVSNPQVIAFDLREPALPTP